ncbi:thermonuclease family protein [Haliangium sp.]|uniref:thermonuclease family protein n=1 Tax=Haliangium sp. TaxID=2663208 RepID=UPI003D134157
MRFEPKVLCSPLLLALVASVALAAAATPAGADEPLTRVVLNGTPVAVFFNDGDTFRIKSGPMKGTSARLAGFNTLESYGPVHVWGDWTVKEMYFLAKIATLNARRGSWTCESDGARDTYGRLLAWCPDLAEDQIRKGLAHAMTITDDPADPRLLAAQHEAIEARRGMWSHGVPAFVLTSLHSVEEDTSGRGTYNRLVSSEDGHSVPWRHEDHYDECAKICHLVYPVDQAKVAAVAAELQAASAGGTEAAGGGEAQAALSALDPAARTALLREYAQFRHIGRQVPVEVRPAVKALLDGYAAAGRFGAGEPEPGACMVYVDFKRRFGRGRATCLK